MVLNVDVFIHYVVKESIKYFLFKKMTIQIIKIVITRYRYVNLLT